MTIRVAQITLLKKEINIGCIMLLAMLLSTAYTFGQKYNFINFNVENGLAQSQATVFSQNQNNELLIGTFGGLSIFDGSAFVNYNKSKGLPQNVIYALSFDKRHNIWVGNANSVSRFDGKKFKTFPLHSATSINQIDDIEVDFQNNVWVVANFKLFRFDGKQFIEDKTIDTVKAITIDKSGKLWAANYPEGIFVYDGKKWHKEIDNKNDRSLFVGKMSFGKYTGSLYGLTSKGLMVIDKGKFISPEWLATLPFSGAINSMLEDSKGNIWLAFNDGGVWCYSLNKWTHYTYQNGFTDDYINSFFEDAEGNIWFATNGSGIFRFTGSLFTYYDRGSGLQTPSIMSITQTKKGEIYLGSNSSGLYKLMNGIPKKVTMPLHASKINSILVDSLDKVWIGTSDAGLWTYDGKKTKELINTNIGVNHLYSDNNTIWISAQTGLYRIQNDTLRREKNVTSPSIFASISIGVDSLLIGTINGAYIYKSDTRTLVSKPLLANTTTLCFGEDHKNIYIGTDDRGVEVWNKATGKFISINQKNGLSCNYVYSLLRDRNGNIWVGTGCGIDCITLNGNKIEVKSFGKSDGLLGVESNANASFEDREGFLWFGTTRGVFRYNPYVTSALQQAPKVLLQSVKLYSKDLPDKKYADSTIAFTDLPFMPVLPTNQNHLTFTFKGVYLSNPEKIRYRYQLVGADKSFTETDQNTVVYPNLPPGEYLFKVWASDADGKWYQNAVSYPFTINAPYYTTWYFRLGLGLLLVGIFLGSVYYRNRQKEQRRRWEERLKEEQQAIVRQKTAEDFHDEIGNKLTRINLLATIAEGKLAQSGADVKNILQQIQVNVASLYNGSKDIIWSLQPESDYLDEIVFRIQQNSMELVQDTDVAFVFEQHPDINTHIKLPIDYSRNLIMIFKEAVNNILKHAKANAIKFSITEDKGQIVFELRDNGIGFDMDKTVKGNGIGNISNRAARINATVEFDSVMSKGTIIKLRLKALK